MEKRMANREKNEQISFLEAVGLMYKICMAHIYRCISAFGKAIEIVVCRVTTE